MPGANRKAEASKPRQPKTNGFDYDKVDKTAAEQMRGAADGNEFRQSLNNSENDRLY